MMDTLDKFVTVREGDIDAPAHKDEARFWGAMSLARRGAQHA
jgi:hypothetical protein